jgi:hypothetical protein
MLEEANYGHNIDVNSLSVFIAIYSPVDLKYLACVVTPA